MPVFNIFPEHGKHPSFESINCRIYGKTWGPRSRFTSRGAEVDGTSPTIDVPRPLIPMADPDMLSKAFRVLDLDLLIRSNAEKHNTLYFYCVKQDDLIIRRGNPFNVKVSFSEAYDPKKHELSLLLITGDLPTPSNRTLVSIKVGEEPFEDDRWWSNVVDQDKTEVVLSIHPPVNCIIGEWDLFVRTEAPNLPCEHYNLYDHNIPIIILFNPWCKGDRVYLEETEKLNEYVIKDYVTIFMGTKEQLDYKHWHLGQYDEGVLDFSLYILRKNFPIVNYMLANPVTVLSGLNRMIAYDSKAIMSILWQENDPFSKRPTAWTSTRDILQEYKTGPRKIKYGSCWINAALLTTFSRAIGIPVRVVTCFSSNHDINSSTIMSHYLTKDNKIQRMPCLTRQSIWSFHVWMDAWIIRPELPEKPHGWHAVDPTPQRFNYGFGVFGPTPLKFIKSGGYTSDVGVERFYNEVNVKYISYINSTKGWKVFQEDTEIVGHFICTAMPFVKLCHRTAPDVVEYMYEDITEEYKFINKMKNLAAERSQNQNSPIKVKLQSKFNSKIGEKQIIVIQLVNESDEMANIDMNLEVRVVDYTGTEYITLFQENYNGQIPARLYESRTIIICQEKYLDILKRGLPYRFAMKLMAYGLVLNADKNFTWMKILIPQWPKLLIKCPERVSIGGCLQLQIMMTNPLPIPLTNCEIIIDGLGLKKVFREPIKNIPNHITFCLDMALVPTITGTAHIIVTIHSVELQDIWSCVSVTVS